MPRHYTRRLASAPQPPLPQSYGRLAGRQTPHPFVGHTSACDACYGWYDDPRHLVADRG